MQCFRLIVTLTIQLLCNDDYLVMNKTSWRVDLVTMDIEVIAILLNSFLVVGMNIPTFSPPFLKSRFPGEIRPPVLPHCSAVPKMLRPSTGTDDDDGSDDDDYRGHDHSIDDDDYNNNHDDDDDDDDDDKVMT